MRIQNAKRIFLTPLLFANTALSEPIIFLSPSDITSAPNQRITLTLKAEGIEDAIAIQVDLSFDPDVVEIEEVEKCDLFSWLIWKEKKRRIIAGVNLGDLSISGSGARCRITLSAKSDSAIRIERAWAVKIAQRACQRLLVQR